MKKFAVQFRSMHTAIHGILVFSDKKEAEEVYAFMDSAEEIPDAPMTSCVDQKEIDYRNPPQEYTYINDSRGIPDIYNT